MRTDYHMHCDYSPDGKATLAEMVEASARMGMDVICFTDHCDIGPESFKAWGPPDFVKMRAELEVLRDKFPDLEVRVGIEAGDMIVDREVVQDIVRAQPLDFVLLSTHVTNGVDMYKYAEFTKDGVREAYDAYLDNVYDSVLHFGDYDSVAHIGYCAKFAPPGALRLQYKDFPDKLDAILRALIEQGKTLECNTSGYARLGEPIPGFDIIARFAELGGEFLTFGSDTHAPERIDDRLSESRARAKELGIKYNAIYRERKPFMEKL